MSVAARSMDVALGFIKSGWQRTREALNSTLVEFFFSALLTSFGKSLFEHHEAVTRVLFHLLHWASRSNHFPNYFSE